MSSIQTFDEFTKAHTGPPGPGISVPMRGEVRSRIAVSLGLSADADMPEIEAAMEEFAADLRAKEEGHGQLTPVQRRGALNVPPVTRKAPKSMRAVPIGTLRRAARRPW